MRYPDIIGLIDSRLALLQQVRELVAPSCINAHSPLPQPRVRNEARSRTFVKSEVIAADSLKSGVAGRSPQPLRLPSAPRKERVSRTKITVALKAASALTGNVPNLPVAISADQVRAAEDRKQSVATQPLPGNDLASLNTEQIARRWLQDLKVATA